MRISATTGFFSASSRRASYSASPPVVLPPGELIEMTTPLTAARLADLFDHFQRLAVFDDKTFDRDARHVGRSLGQSGRAGSQQDAGDKRRGDDNEGGNPPEGHFAPEAPSINQGVNINRHEFSVSGKRFENQ